ncbi:MAG: hypothetical protein JWS10_1835 [Cypionkella sp.]|uniref:hypothetical protein n=1 Tax=Cypionkella sp. TaxID=2811411 RepID=UPI002621CFFF|nr:hypothetical protein [Cypionkella sp.]MDB5659220.1 hypothetical protein [Cypionkella sp.]
MAATLQQIEGVPAAWPTVPAGLSVEANALDPAFVWGRIEPYTTCRFTSRSVAWVVEGPGEWMPPLAPATVAAVEGWTGMAWAAVVLNPSPLGGYDLPAVGPYRFTGTAGGGVVPAPVSEAYRRLAEYFGAPNDSPPGSADMQSAIGPISENISRQATWLARAMINSGAADLLRPYRRAA